MKRKKVVEFILRHRIKVLILLTFITVAFAAIASQGKLSFNFGDFLYKDQHPQYSRYKELVSGFSSDEITMILGIEDKELLSPRSINRLEKALAKVEKSAGVRRTHSILQAKKVFFSTMNFHTITYCEWLKNKPKKRAQAIKELTSKQSPYRDLLISKDGRHTAVIIELKQDNMIPTEPIPKTVNEILSIFDDVGIDRKKIHLYGVPTVMVEILRLVKYNISRIFPLVAVITILIIYFIFKRLWPVLITIGISILASIWTVGFTVLLYKDINLYISVAPAIIMIIATSDVVHLCNAYLLEHSRLQNKREAILISASEVGSACFMTSITTFIGFFSLSFIPIRAFQQLGVTLGFGVGIALLLAMTLTPIFFSFMKAPRPWTEENSLGHKIIGGALGKIEKLITRRPWTVIYLFIGIAALSAYGISQLYFDTDLIKRLNYDNSLRKDERYFKDNFVSPNIVTMVVKADDKNGLLAPEIFAKALEVQEQLEQHPEVDRVYSLASIVLEIERKLNPGRQIPLTKEKLKGYFLLMEKVAGNNLYRLVDKEKKTMLFEIRLRGSGVRTIYKKGKDFEKIGVRHFGNLAMVEATGLNFIIGQFLSEVFKGQQRGLMFAFLSISFLMIIWVKSIRIGLWSMIPNILPLVSLLGLLGILWHPVDSDVLLIVMLAIGIGVDDTIHFMVRFRYESERSQDSAIVLKNTFHFTGRSIIITTVILAIGLLPFALSDYFSINIIGTLLPFTLIIAMLADVLLVPALVRVGLVRYKRV